MFNQIYIEDPEMIPHQFAAAWNRRDAIGIANLFADDSDFVNVVGLWWQTREEIWKAHDYGLRVIFQDSSLEVRKIRVNMISNDVATVHTRFKLTGQSLHKKSSRPGDRFNIFTFVTRKTSRGWYVVAAHNTDQVPFAETNLKNEKGELRPVDYRRKQ